MLNNNEINEAIELYNTHGKQKWAYWLAKKFIKNGEIDTANEWYEESIKKMEEIGRTEVNKYNMFIKFYCTPENTISYQPS